jgi:hypothetical protein
MQSDAFHTKFYPGQVGVKSGFEFTHLIENGRETGGIRKSHSTLDGDAIPKAIPMFSVRTQSEDQNASGLAIAILG